MTDQTIWCLGMYGSASTWLFNVVRQVQGESDTAQPVSHFFSREESFESFSRGNTVDLVKSHEISDDATIIELASRVRKMFITVRDPRDAVVSLMLARSHTFERALHFVGQSARLCAEFSGDKRAQLFVYETEFFNVVGTVKRVAVHLGFSITNEAMQRIFAATSRPEVEKYIAAMHKQSGILQDKVSGDLLDPKTQWHTHHAGRSGEIGRWRQILTSQQIREVEAQVPYFLAV
ncbi:MAG: hypothetical protein P4L52_08090 [Acidocella sp.]|nr:hypothetical protein [Acidocella sp.]